jgi:sugar phosphate permease
MPVMEKDLHIGKAQLGIFLTLHGVLYGISKFANGFLGDRCNGRSLMVVGLAISAALNVWFGFSSTILAFGVIWMLNGWVQGMGFPPCARLMTHWFPPKQLATKMSIWNTSHCIGAVVVLLLGGAVIAWGWRWCFFAPALLALICVVFLWLNLADTPPSVGLPEVEGTVTESGADFKNVVMKQLFRNKYIWMVALANFFVYTLRYAVFDWGPTMLTESKHIKIQHAAWMLAGFEVCGAFGVVMGGWITDRFLGGRGMRTCVFYMFCTGISVLLLWKVAGDSKLLNAGLLCATGFFIYGPQCLVGIAAANLATRKAAASAVGLTGLFGYASTVLSGWGLGALVQRHGWDAGFIGLLITAAIGTLIFAAGWPAKAHGYHEGPDADAPRTQAAH